MSHPIQCQCGCLKGTVDDVTHANRVICYCQDCQAFAHFLGKGSEILDRHGGTDIVQTLPKNISFTQGTEVLACVRLTETGLLRWYTTCCNTPIGNTLPIYKMSFIGLVHNCLESSEITLDNAFGATCIPVNTTYSKGEIKSNPVDLIVTIIRNVTRIFRARIDGSYKQTPFFLVDSGIPIVSPKILSCQEYEDIMSAV
ncbi:DUF6151 family protein [Leptothoe sp. ISB3NOV94-8A]|uniref:CENP-V/GFA domain-containing protein n=1 Tax=Adonisia turfae CCMR0081 TaxID=2292702 RepID=A0A6M0RQH0_9CYAN|nr:DUF6151 family protein [Adonisia turfae]NEZ58120.1 hypothetical protein [Adonisia turfae CCMR0081]